MATFLRPANDWGAVDRSVHHVSWTLHCVPKF